MKKLYMFLLFTSIIVNKLFAQPVEGYDFEKYKVAKTAIKGKAKINWQTSPALKDFKAKISHGYNKGFINFAGYYIAIIWGCGSSCLNGAMVDVRDGKVYNLPKSLEIASDRCYSNMPINDSELIFFKDFSRLFITSTCNEIENKESNTYLQEKVFFVNVWNEKLKKFRILEKVEKKNSNK